MCLSLLKAGEQNYINFLKREEAVWDEDLSGVSVVAKQVKALPAVSSSHKDAGSSPGC